MTKRENTWDILEEVLNSTEFKREPLPDGDPRFWFWRNSDDTFAQLNIYTYNPNTYKEGEMRHTRHEFIVPAATYHRQGWIRWLFDRILSVDAHETTEHFFVDGVRVYAPHHGNGWDPYTFWPGHDISEKLKAPGED